MMSRAQDCGRDIAGAGCVGRLDDACWRLICPPGVWNGRGHVAMFDGERPAVAKVHPGFEADRGKPVGDGRDDAAAIFHHMLLADETDGHVFAGAVGNGDAELTFAFEDSLTVVTQGAVAGVRPHFLGGVEPLVDSQVIVGRAAEPTSRRLGVEMRMAHGCTELFAWARASGVFRDPNDLVDWERIVFCEARVHDGLVPVNVAGEGLVGEIEGERCAATIPIVPIDVGGLEVVVAKTREVSVKRRIERDLGRVSCRCR